MASSQAAEYVADQPVEFDTDSDSLIVLSHDCDVTNDDFGREPFAELLVARSVRQPDGSLTFGKNPRRIQYDVVGSDSVTKVESDINNRFRVDRETLLASSPDDDWFLSPETANLLGLWAARRYRRSAFPDEFNRRLTAAQAEIKAALRRDGVDITGVYVVVTDQELPEDETYEILLYATASVSTYSQEQLRLKCQQALDRVGAAMDSCNGISVTDSGLRSESGVTLDDLHLLKRWDVHDDLSMRSEGEGELSAKI